MISVKGVKSSYKVEGEGRPLLILHGWGASSDSWVEVQKKLSKKYKVICPDLPGFGKSEMPPLPWGVEDYKDWVVQFLKALQIDDFLLIGHSFGGRISIKLSSEGFVEKMVLCAPAGIKIKRDVKTSLLLLLSKATPLKPLKKIFYFLIRKRDYAKAKGVMRETMKKVVSEDLTSLLPRIEAETLLIWGREDKLIPVKYANIFKKEIKNSRLLVIEKAGHSPNLNTPDKLTEEIFKFL